MDRIWENQKTNAIRHSNMKNITKQQAEERVKGMKFKLAEYFDLDDGHWTV